MSAFTRADLAVTYATRSQSGAPEESCVAFSSSTRSSTGSRMSPCLMISPNPSMNERFGSVRSVSMSLTTAVGWWNAPTRFFPAARSTATLPPIAASFIASTEVGTCTSGIPRR